MMPGGGMSVWTKEYRFAFAEDFWLLATRKILCNIGATGWFGLIFRLHRLQTLGLRLDDSHSGIYFHVELCYLLE